MHVLGRQNQWSGTAAELGLRLMARQRDGAGRPIAADATAMAEIILARLTRHSARPGVEAAFVDAYRFSMALATGAGLSATLLAALLVPAKRAP
jgi:hypothetical protein